VCENCPINDWHLRSDERWLIFTYCIVKVKVIPQQAGVSQEVPGRLRHRIFLTFGTTRLVGRQPYAPAAFTPGEIPGTHFQRLSRPQGTWFRREPRKKSPVTPPGIDPGTSRLAAQCLKHYATPGPTYCIVPGSNLVTEFSCRGKHQNVPRVRFRHVPFTSLAIHYSLIISFDAVVMVAECVVEW
jgi:hypothetical protein